MFCIAAAVQWPQGGWIKANMDQTGFYRVNYEEANWLEIISYLKRVNLEESVGHHDNIVTFAAQQCWCV